MRASELRVGNWINHAAEFAANTNNIQATAEDIVKVKDNPSHYLDIPLTEEWLLKFGFTHHAEYPGHTYMRTEKLTLSVDQDSDDDIIQVHYIDKSTYIQIKYVHQLQNLYFNLTGMNLITS
jgi:hypothetical protein